VGAHKYLVSNGQGLSKNMIIDLIPSIYKESNTSTYDVYIGEYKSEKDWERSGFGSYFFEKWNKSDWSVYSGNWESNKYNGVGGYDKNGYKYSGNFQDGNLKNGKCIWPDKTTYTGDFQNFSMHGIGTLTYANGEVKYGYFQNNSFVKSYDDYVREINEQEERRIQEEQASAERAIAEEARAEKSRAEEARAAKAAQEARIVYTNISKTNCKYCSTSISCTKKSDSQLDWEKTMAPITDMAIGGGSFVRGLENIFSQSMGMGKKHSDPNAIYINRYSCPDFCSRKCQDLNNGR
jgi:hypothetical protein